jgi:hypothetical protein
LASPEKPEIGAVVTTDLFAFDHSTDFCKLQGLGRACDMGDAATWVTQRSAMRCRLAPGSIGMPCAMHPIRRSSPRRDIKAAKHKAGQIYAEWGAFTTAASAIASWAIIDARFNH